MGQITANIKSGQLSFLTSFPQSKQTSKSSHANWKAIGVPKHGDTRICNKGHTQICYSRTLFPPNKCQNIFRWLKGGGSSYCKGPTGWEMKGPPFKSWWGQNIEDVQVAGGGFALSKVPNSGEQWAGDWFRAVPCFHPYAAGFGSSILPVTPKGIRRLKKKFPPNKHHNIFCRFPSILK